MLYKFKSRSAPDLIMLEPHGRQILQIIGKTPGPTGIITAAQIPAVRLHQRAAPFLEMLRRSVAQEHDVVWGA